MTDNLGSTPGGRGKISKQSMPVSTKPPTNLPSPKKPPPCFFRTSPKSPRVVKIVAICPGSRFCFSFDALPLEAYDWVVQSRPRPRRLRQRRDDACRNRIRRKTRHRHRTSLAAPPDQACSHDRHQTAPDNRCAGCPSERTLFRGYPLLAGRPRPAFRIS